MKRSRRERLSRLKKDVDILIPSFGRTSSLFLTLNSLAFQSFSSFDVIISDQNSNLAIEELEEFIILRRLLEQNGHNVEVRKNLPRRGMAQQRQFLLDSSKADLVLFLDDDVICEPDLVERLVNMIRIQQCGFVGSALIGLSYVKDQRPDEQDITFWDTKVEPEQVSPNSQKWQRHKLHNAANILHVQNKLHISKQNSKAYKVAWVGGCVLYDAKKLKQCGGFSFWEQLPLDHSGEDVLAQLRVMKSFGGCGIIPSGAYHQEFPTTIRNREVDAPLVLV